MSDNNNSSSSSSNSNSTNNPPVGGGDGDLELRQLALQYHMENDRQTTATLLEIMQRTLLDFELTAFISREQINRIVGLSTMTPEEYDNELYAIRDSIYGIAPEEIEQLLNNIIRRARRDGGN